MRIGCLKWRLGPWKYTGDVPRTRWLKLGGQHHEGRGKEVSEQEARIIKHLSMWMLEVIKDHDRSNTGD